MISALSQYHLSLFSLNNDISLAPQKAVPIFCEMLNISVCTGFDLSHEISTQYSDLEKLLRSKNPAADMLEEYLPSRPGEIPDTRVMHIHEYTDSPILTASRLSDSP